MVTKHVFFVKTLRKIKRYVKRDENQDEKTLAGFCFNLRMDIVQLKGYFELNKDKLSSKRAKNNLKDLFVYYWYCSQLWLFYNELPYKRELQIVYLQERLAFYKANFRIYPLDYQQYCAGELYTDNTKLLEYSHCFYDSDISFFDEKYPCFIPIYLEANEMIIERLTALLVEQSETTVGLFHWNASQVDLAMLIYALIKSEVVTSKSGKTATSKRLAKELSSVFNIDISNTIFQTINSFKNRKCTKKNILNTLLSFLEK